MNRLFKPFSRFRKAESGAISIEFGILASVLIAMLLTGVEFGRFLIAGQKADRSVTAVGDILAQHTSINSQGMKDIFEAGAKILAHYHYKGKGVLIVSHVHAETDGSAKVTWQTYSSKSLRPKSKIGSPGGRAKLPKTLSVKAGDTVMVVEAKVRFEPMLFDLVASAQDIYRVTYYRPRKSDQIAYDRTGDVTIDVRDCASANPGPGSAEVCGNNGDGGKKKKSGKSMKSGK